MPTVNSTVGPTLIPAPAGATNAIFADLTCDGLIDYFAFWIKWAMDAKLATMTSPPCTDACPVANRFTIDPSTIVTNYNLPALFLWTGKSERAQRTLIRDMRIRELRILYVFPHLLGLPQVQLWSGAMQTVDAAIRRACERRSHPQYAFNGSAPGASIFTMFKILGMEHQSSDEGFMRELVSASIRDAATTGRSTARNDGAVQRGYPALHTSVRIFEDVFGDQPLPTDADAGVTVALETGDDMSTTPILSRVLAPPVNIQFTGELGNQTGTIEPGAP